MDNETLTPLFDHANVVGVGVDPDSGVVNVYVTKKKPKAKLDPHDIVPDTVDGVETDVIGVGLDQDAPGFPIQNLQTPENDPTPGEAPPKERHRPIPGGVSEHHRDGGGATGGPLAVVRDESRLDAAPGSVVRLSNNHVYARRNEATLGDPIYQPSPLDGGTEADTVGHYCGTVPIEEGVRVDVAARTTTTEDIAKIHYQTAEWPTGVATIDGSVIGKTVEKSGRTTGRSQGTVESINAIVSISFGEPIGTIQMTECVVTTDMSEPGDSGSHVTFIDDGLSLGLLFAGSDTRTIHATMENIETDLGVDLMTTEETEPEPEPAAEPSFTETITVDMREPETWLIEAVPVSDPPASGDSVDIAVTVGANYPMDIAIEVASSVDRAEETLTLGESERAAEGHFERTTTLTVTAPDVYHPEGMTVTVSGAGVQ